MPESLRSNPAHGNGREPVASWRRHANCLEVEPETFFATKGIHCRSAINTYCLPCPVRSECLAEGFKEQFGIWGGTTPKERKKLRARQALERGILSIPSSNSSIARLAQIGAQK